jgi:hypothetical protein
MSLLDRYKIYVDARALIAIGQTGAGRYLKVVYVPDPTLDSVFDISAYDLGPKAKRAIRRKRRKRT